MSGSEDGATIERPARVLLALEEERDHLLRALDQLDQEHQDGDIDDHDYQELTDGYTARAAAVMHRIEDVRSSGSMSTSSEGSPASSTLHDGAPDRVPTAAAVEDASMAQATARGESEQAPSASGSAKGWVRKIIVVGALALFTVGAGFALAQASGERGVQDQLTGGIDDSARTKILSCQELGAGGNDLLGALECFDDVLAEDPDNAEALAYRGWYLILAAGSVQASADNDEEMANAEELRAAGLVYLDRAVEADPSYPDPLAFRAIVYDRMGQSERVCAEIETLLALDPPTFFVDQTAGLASRNGC